MPSFLDKDNSGFTEFNDAVSQQANRKTLAGDPMDAMLGKSTPNRDAFDMVWGRLNDNDVKKGLQYPIDLTSDDTVHFLLIKIFNGDSGEVQNIQRSVEMAGMIETSVMQGMTPPDDAEDDWVAPSVDEFFPTGAMQVYTGDGMTYYIGADSFENGELVNVTRRGQRNVSVNPGGAPLQRTVNETISYEEFISTLERERQKAASTQNANISNTYKTPVEKMKAGLHRATQRKATARQEETIALYLPHKLNVAGFNTYDTPDFEVIKNVQGLLDGQVSAVMSTLIRRGAGMIDSLGAIAGTEINAERAIAAATGRVINPRRETLYQSPEMRKFEFAFEFTPRNYDESVMVHNIIKTLKHHAYPKKQMQGVFLDMPAEFLLEYYMIDEEGTARENLWLNRIGRCVLQEINVDYTGSGSVAMFRNGAPSHINMTLSFQEVELITQEAVDLGY